MSIDFHGQANWQQGGGVCLCDFIQLSRPFLTLKAKVASETLLLPWSSNFTSFVPLDQALGGIIYFQAFPLGFSDQPVILWTHTSNGLCFETESNLMAWGPNSFSSTAIKGCRLLLLSPLIFVIVM